MALCGAHRPEGSEQIHPSGNSCDFRVQGSTRQNQVTRQPKPALKCPSRRGLLGGGAIATSRHSHLNPSYFCVVVDLPFAVSPMLVRPCLRAHSAYAHYACWLLPIHTCICRHARLSSSQVPPGPSGWALMNNCRRRATAGPWLPLVATRQPAGSQATPPTGRPEQGVNSVGALAVTYPSMPQTSAPSPTFGCAPACSQAPSESSDLLGARPSYQWRGSATLGHCTI